MGVLPVTLQKSFLSRLFSVCLPSSRSYTHKSPRRGKIHCHLFLWSTALWEEARGDRSLIPSDWVYRPDGGGGGTKADVVSQGRSTGEKSPVLYVYFKEAFIHEWWPCWWKKLIVSSFQRSFQSAHRALAVRCMFSHARLSTFQLCPATKKDGRNPHVTRTSTLTVNCAKVVATWCHKKEEDSH